MTSNGLGAGMLSQQSSLNMGMHLNASNQVKLSDLSPNQSACFAAFNGLNGCNVMPLTGQSGGTTNVGAANMLAGMQQPFNGFGAPANVVHFERDSKSVA